MERAWVLETWAWTLAISFTVWFWTSFLTFLCLHSVSYKMRINYMTYFKELPWRWNVKANLYYKGIRTSSEDYKKKYLNHSIIYFQHLQSSEHCKAYTDEQDSVLFSKSLKLCNKEMTIPRGERVSMSVEWSWVCREMDMSEGRRGREASPWRILIGGNGKDRRRQNISGRGNQMHRQSKYF